VKFFGSQDVLVSASSDHTSRIWRASGDDGAMVAAAVLKTHGAEVCTPSARCHMPAQTSMHPALNSCSAYPAALPKRTSKSCVPHLHGNCWHLVLDVQILQLSCRSQQ
jgi:hypothetical protein